jgi:hypothetical protein
MCPPTMTSSCSLHSISSFFPFRSGTSRSLTKPVIKSDIREPACEAAIRKGMEVYTRELIGGVQQRVESRRSAEALLLPPLNFHLKEQRAKDAFCELTRGARAWANAMPEGITPEMFDRQRLPDFLGHQETQVIYKDTRGVVFSVLPSYRTLTENKSLTTVPKSRYFVTFCKAPTVSEHPCHRAFITTHNLKADGTSKQRRSNALATGQLSVSATHANIYPNDSVRPAP